jgi:hypothetical protein
VTSKTKPINRKVILLITTVGLLSLSIYVILGLVAFGRNFVPISVLCLIAGVLFEGKRILVRWSVLLGTVTGAAAFSYFALIPGKNESSYNLGTHVELMPYFFIVGFAFACIVLNHDKVTAQLTEGMTLLQSIALTYWVMDLHAYETTQTFIRGLILIGVLFAVFALFHALTRVTLSRPSRLALSIWSSLIMLVFAIDHVYGVYQNKPIQSSIRLPEGFLIGLQFFLLGIAAIYIVQNTLMLVGFLPGKKTFFNAQYFKELGELNQEHVERYSSNQVNPLQSLLCIVLTGGFFFLNSKLRILPRPFAIWIMFVIFPYLMLPVSALQTRNSAAR